MSSALSSWYHNQYLTWNRTRRMQTAPYLARQDSPTTRLTRAVSRPETGSPVPGDTVINMGDLLPPPTADRVQSTDKKKQDTLFGPSIGIVNPGPDWADQKIEQGEKAQLQDILTRELIKSWVEKSKEASQPTTTLQALVNLKRPSLRLSPISDDDPDDPENPPPQRHGLEFYFDCDAPRCGISLQIISASTTKECALSSGTLVDVFHKVVDGGFGKVLKLEAGATLELDKYDPSAPSRVVTSTPAVETSTDAEPTPTPVAPDAPTETVSHLKKRFTLRIRKRNPDEDANHVNVAGPALQVVDVETPAEAASPQEKEAKEKSDGGVKVLIKLEALDANDHTLVSPNSQATYLHIVRLGPPPAATAPDSRPWVVRVVKREATIGPHTFHLHEIYGLTSHAPAPAPAPEHAYPPVGTDADDPTSECLLCLSSPREVVLLPCRHLVACKECAVNMIEFGAGGQLVHSDDTAGDTTANTTGTMPDETPGEGSGIANGAETPQPQQSAAPRPMNPRRKRKAKGWFCPVCRQPYTSLLRISTSPPSAARAKQLESEAFPAPATTTDQTTAGPPRPGFLRAISQAAARVTGSENTHNNNDSGARGEESTAV